MTLVGEETPFFTDDVTIDDTLFVQLDLGDAPAVVQVGFKEIDIVTDGWRCARRDRQDASRAVRRMHSGPCRSIGPRTAAMVILARQARATLVDAGSRMATTLGTGAVPVAVAPRSRRRAAPSLRASAARFRGYAVKLRAESAASLGVVDPEALRYTAAMRTIYVEDGSPRCQTRRATATVRR